MTDEQLLDFGRYLHDMVKELPCEEWFVMSFAFKLDKHDAGLYIENFTVSKDEE